MMSENGQLMIAFGNVTIGVVFISMYMARKVN